MRIVRLFAPLIVVAAAAACTGNGNTAPTATPLSAQSAATATTAAEATSSAANLSPETTETPVNALVTLAAANSILITPQVAGTIGYQSHEGTPNYTAAPLDFDTVTFARATGESSDILRVRLHADGTLEINDTTTTVDAATVENIRSLLDQAHFFDITGSFTGPNEQANGYRYSLGVSGSRGAVTILAQDGYVPVELQVVFDAMVALTQEVTPSP